MKLAVERNIVLIRVLLAMFTASLSLIAGGLVILLAGGNPLPAYYWLFQGAFTLASIPETLIRATPLLLVAIGLAIPFTAKIWNIGGEGQLYMGAMGAAIIGILLKNAPGAVAFPMIILGAGVAGAAWALLPAFLRARYGTNEIITTLMFNYISLYLISYLLQNPFRDPVSSFPETQTIPEHLWAPTLAAGTRLHVGVVIAFLLVVPVAYLVLKKTSFGLSLEILGSSPRTARYSGINAGKLIIQAMLISGFLAGLAGGLEVLGIQHKMRLEISPGYGFAGIAVALLGFLNPAAIALTSIFLGGVINGSTTLSRMVMMPAGMASIIQSLLIVFVLIGYLLEDKFASKVIERSKVG